MANHRPPSAFIRGSLAALAAAVLLIVLGGKFQLIRSHGTDVPSWDQWDAEGNLLLRPYFDGTLTWREILQAHNEHRIVFTKLIALGLVKANGQWDAELGMTLNALVHALFAACLFFFLARDWIPPRHRPLFALAAGALFALPYGWENTLWAFQSQLYFLQLFSIGHLYLMTASRPLSGRWIAGLLCGAAALFAMGSGLLSAAALIGVAGVRCLMHRNLDRDDLLLAAANLPLLIAGWALRTHIAEHEVLRAQSIGEFLLSFFRSLSWPWPELLLISIFLQLPLLLFVVRMLATAVRGSRNSPTRLEARAGGRPYPWPLFSLAAWFLLQAAAVSYVRGNLDTGLSPRYFDLLAPGLLLNLACWAALLRLREGRGIPPAIAAGVALWIVLVAAGLARQSIEPFSTYLAAGPEGDAAQVVNVRAFLETGDVEILEAAPLLHIPYPDPHALAYFLDHDALRSVLPESIRDPVPVLAAKALGFTSDELPAGMEPFRRLPHWASDPWHPGRAEFLSAPIDGELLPFLRLRVSGDLRREGSSLELVDLEGRLIERVAADSAPGNRWKAVHVATPSGPFRIRASVEEAGGWLAFTWPAEVGRFSWLAGKVRKAGLALIVLGGVLCGFFFVAGSPGRGAFAARALPRLRDGWSASRVFGAAAVPVLGLSLLSPYDPDARSGRNYASLLSGASFGGEALAPLHLSHDGFDPAEAVPLEPLLRQRLFGTWGPAGDAYTGEMASTPFRLPDAFLYVPVVGYPSTAGNRLSVEFLDEDRPPLIFSGPNPGDRVGLWEIDTAAMAGARVRIVLRDATTDFHGWLGIGPPWVAEQAGLASEFDRAIGMPGTVYLRTLVIGAAWLALLFVPGLCLRRLSRRPFPGTAALIPVPGFLLLALFGTFLWVSGASKDDIWGQAYLAFALAGALFLAGWGVPGGSRVAAGAKETATHQGTHPDRLPFALFGSALLIAWIYSFLPLPVAGEFFPRTSFQSRMVASPPDHMIPYHTAAFFHHGHPPVGSAAYFGEPWTVASRGPLMPLALNAGFNLFRISPDNPPGTRAGSWPAERDGFFIARLTGTAANALVILGAAYLLAALGQGRGFRRDFGLTWLALAPALLINTSFLWPKLLAAFFVLLAVADAWKRDSPARIGLWAALAWLSHPVGVLFIPCVGLLLYHRSAGQWIPSSSARASEAWKLTARYGFWLGLFMAPWLAFKLALGDPDTFWQYPLGDGRGFFVAESVGSWLTTRWENLVLTLVPGAFWFSDMMNFWFGASLSEPLRWTIQYAKSLPAGLGFSLFWVAYLAVLPRRPAIPSVLAACCLGLPIAFMLLVWGFSSDGLGRNCLEPVFPLAIVLAAAFSPHLTPRWGILLLGLLLLEAYWTVFAGFLAADGFNASELPLSHRLHLGILAAALALPLGLFLVLPRIGDEGEGISHR